MRILVVSDTHGDGYALQNALWAQPEAHLVFHLGDGARELEQVAAANPDRTFYGVRGNCDSEFCDLLGNREETVGGKRIFFTHGHLWSVKFTLSRIDYAARERRADIALFGHTHQPLSLYEDGVYLINPGSLGYNKQYATVDIVSGGIMPILHTLR
ncbi:MAG: metallophosphoesterase [Ruminococcaceae bacterium]|nr:metallophosphoesterase [Oscillospiraceae bacterium]